MANKNINSCGRASILDCALVGDFPSSWVKSNLVTLIAWAALLFLPNLGTLVLHGLCFLYLLFLDQSLFLRGYLPPWYYSLRRMVTVLVFTLIVLLMGALTF
ncbi:MAG: DUF3429 family protein [Alphaproteobacteria bacterium]|nr:DUF3429 family protein [Alphaproteobacteria bacterium]